jgi:uroporphyrinogen decarboxylase
VKRCSIVKTAFRRNIDSSDFLEVASEEVYKRALKCLEESQGFPGFILGSAVLPYGTPVSHLAAMREAVQEFKKRPASSH